MEKKRVTTKVNIFGAEYTIRAEADPEYVRKVARYVDAKMREIGDSLRLDSPTKVAILAAINITDELFRERADKESIVLELEGKLKDLYHRLNQGLERVLQDRYQEEGYPDRLVGLEGGGR